MNLTNIKRNKNRDTKQPLATEGFTIVETLIAMVIFTIVLTGGIALYYNTSKVSMLAVHKKMATEIINAKMEEIKLSPDDFYSATGPFNITTPSKLGELALAWQGTVTDDGTFCPATGYQRVNLVLSWQETFQSFPRTIQLVNCVKP